MGRVQTTDDWLGGWRPVALLSELFSQQAPLDSAALLLTGGAVGALVLLPTWRLLRHGITIVHEAGHGAAATLTGRSLSGIRLHSDTSGVTVSRGPIRGPGMLLTLLAGYPAPAVLGLGAAFLISRGYPLAVLWGALLVLALVLVQIRNWFGLWSVLVATAVIGVVTWLFPPEGQSVFAWAITAFLLLGAVRTIVELQGARRRGRARGRARGSRSAAGSDADQLASLTGVPGIVWVALFALIALSCLLGSATLLGLIDAAGLLGMTP